MEASKPNGVVAPTPLASTSSESESIIPKFDGLGVLALGPFFEDDNSCSSLEKLLSEWRLNPWQRVSHTVSWLLRSLHHCNLNGNGS